MSKFSGKFDLADDLLMNDCSEEEINERIRNSKFYVGDIRIKADELKDLIPYYPFTITICTFDNNEFYIRLSKESYVDRNERNSLLWRKNEMVRVLNRAKRKKLPITKDLLIESLSTYFREEECLDKLADRVLRFGKKAEYRDLHYLHFNKLYRDPLYEEMIKNGYSEDFANYWVYKRNAFLSEDGKMRKEE